jgi:hypothetical protein
MTDTVRTAPAARVIGVDKDGAALNPSDYDGTTVESFQPPALQEEHR